jgi:hypothetical protein
MHYAMTEEELELTKHWVRQFIIAQKLGIQTKEVQVPESTMATLRNLWLCDDTRRREYRMLWDQVEKEMQHAP